MDCSRSHFPYSLSAAWVSQQILFFMEGDSDQDGFNPTIRSTYIFDLDSEDQSGRFPVIRSRSIIPFTTHVTGGTKVQRVRAAVQVEPIDQMHVIGTRLVHLSTVWFGWDKWVNLKFRATYLLLPIEMWGCSTSAILFSIYIWSIICFEKWWFGVISPSLRSITENDQSCNLCHFGSRLIILGLFVLPSLFQGGIFLFHQIQPWFSLIGWCERVHRQILSFWKGSVNRSCCSWRVIQIRMGSIQPSDLFSFLIWILKINLVDFQYRSRSIIPFTTHVTRGTKVQSVRAAAQVECIDQMHVIGTRLTYVYIYI